MRNTNLDDLDGNSQPGDPGPEDESNNVEKILGVRTGKRRIMKVSYMQVFILNNNM